MFTRENQPALLGDTGHARALRLRGYHPLRHVVPDDFGFGTSAHSRAHTPHLPLLIERDSVWPVPLSLAVTQGITIVFFSWVY